MATSNARLLLTNDDGIKAPGIQALHDELAPHYEVLVVAPMSQRSGSGCAVSVDKEMAVEVCRDGNGRVWGYAVDGTPADCVKFAAKVVAEFRPDLVLSGINAGSNVGNSVFYSGTCAAAIEATMFGMRACAISLAVWHGRADTWHFPVAARLTASLVPWLLDQHWSPRTFWNLNVPNVPAEELRGVRCARQGTSFYVDDLEFKREADGHRIYSNVGKTVERSIEPLNADDVVLEGGHAALSLLSIDLNVPMPAAARAALEHAWGESWRAANAPGAGM